MSKRCNLERNFFAAPFSKAFAADFHVDNNEEDENGDDGDETV